MDGMRPTLRNIVFSWLVQNGYDGLCNPGACGCDLHDLMPLCEPTESCEAAYKADCDGCWRGDMHDGTCLDQFADSSYMMFVDGPCANFEDVREPRTCGCCELCELHGYPPEGADVKAFTVSAYCVSKGEHVSPYETCKEFLRGEPTKIHDDTDNF